MLKLPSLFMTFSSVRVKFWIFYYLSLKGLSVNCSQKHGLKVCVNLIFCEIKDWRSKYRLMESEDPIIAVENIGKIFQSTNTERWKPRFVKMAISLPVVKIEGTQWILLNYFQKIVKRLSLLRFVKFKRFEKVAQWGQGTNKGK